MDRVIPHGQRVDSCPQSPSGPLADMWMDFSCHDQRDQKADLCKDDSATAEVGFVTDVCKDEDKDQRKGSTNGSQSIRSNSVPAQGSVCSQIFSQAKRRICGDNLLQDGRCVGGQRTPC